MRTSSPRSQASPRCRLAGSAWRRVIISATRLPSISATRACAPTSRVLAPEVPIAPPEPGLPSSSSPRAPRPVSARTPGGAWRPLAAPCLRRKLPQGSGSSRGLATAARPGPANETTGKLPAKTWHHQEPPYERSATFDWLFRPALWLRCRSISAPVPPFAGLKACWRARRLGGRGRFPSSAR